MVRTDPGKPLDEGSSGVLLGNVRVEIKNKAVATRSAKAGVLEESLYLFWRF